MTSRPPSASLIQDQDNLKPEIFKTDEPMLIEGPFLPQKPIPHSPKISPTSIPNPSPSVSTSKIETYPNYGGYLYSIPGYSAFQPVSYPGMGQNVKTIENRNTDYTYHVNVGDKCEEKAIEIDKCDKNFAMQVDDKTQTDFEEQFTPEIIPAVSTAEVNKILTNDPKININMTSTVSVNTQTPSKDAKKKPTERFSLKTSIPISKIDMKCVHAPDALYQMSKKTFTPITQNSKNEVNKLEIQSNILIKSALTNDTRHDTTISTGSNNINALINAAEAINKSDMFRRPDPKIEVIHEVKDPPPITQPTQVRAMFSGPDNKVEGNQAEQKNKLLFIQSKTHPSTNQSNPKMLLAIQQQNPQVLLQRTKFESKNLQAPSRLSSQNKRSNENVMENGSSSKVVALKRLHHENCDENDFENLITENQIYGNKIVVKEKSQGTQQEQDLKRNKKLIDYKTSPQETKNVVLQPNFLYLSNVQFPNLMMIKNNAKIVQTNELNRPKLVATNEHKIVSEASTMILNDINKNAQNVTTSKDYQILKSNNNVLQTLSNMNSKTDLVFQTSHQKVIMNPKIVYKVPVRVDKDSKMNQTLNKEHPNFLGQNIKDSKSTNQKSNDKLYIACPYKMDSKLKPRIVITNIRPKLTKVEEVSTLDLYEKRKKLRRLKHLTHRDTNTKDGVKLENKKIIDRTEYTKNIITPDKMKEEIAKEFANTKITVDDTCSQSDSDYEKDDVNDYESILKEFKPSIFIDNGKTDFLANFRLASLEDYKEKQMERQERMLRRDAVASAYIAVGRIDQLSKDLQPDTKTQEKPIQKQTTHKYDEQENGMMLHKKIMFFSQLNLAQVSTEYRDDYEKTWHEIIKERKRRNGETEQILKQPNVETNNLDFDTNNQLQMLTEIKKSVNENNNLIKQRLDSGDENQLGDSIRVLAEKNFSELSRLSKMADRSVKLITAHEKRDLNPGFDSENIQAIHKYDPPANYPYINIPNFSKIISLKSQDTINSSTTTSQAISMDEPRCSAAGVTDIQDENVEEKTRDVGVQAEFTWPGIEAVMKSYKEFEAARKKEIADLHRRATLLRVEGAHITRNAARDADQARALLAERRHLLAEEGTTRALLTKLCNAIRVIRNYN